MGILQLKAMIRQGQNRANFYSFWAGFALALGWDFFWDLANLHFAESAPDIYIRTNNQQANIVDDYA